MERTDHVPEEPELTILRPFSVALRDVARARRDALAVFIEPDGDRAMTGLSTKDYRFVASAARPTTTIYSGAGEPNSRTRHTISPFTMETPAAWKGSGLKNC